MCISFIVDSVFIQTLVFVLSSIALLFYTKPFVTKLTKKDAVVTNANQIIGKFNSAFEWLAEHEVPEEEQVIFVNPAVMTLIRNTDELKKLL